MRLGEFQMINVSRVMSCPSHSGSISRLTNDNHSPLREGKHGVASGKDDNIRLANYYVQQFQQISRAYAVRLILVLYTFKKIGHRYQ